MILTFHGFRKRKYQEQRKVLKGFCSTWYQSQQVLFMDAEKAALTIGSVGNDCLNWCIVSCHRSDATRSQSYTRSHTVRFKSTIALHMSTSILIRTSPGGHTQTTMVRKQLNAAALPKAGEKFKPALEQNGDDINPDTVATKQFATMRNRASGATQRFGTPQQREVPGALCCVHQRRPPRVAG